MPTPEEIADNTSSQLKPHKYPSIYFGQANGPSHKTDVEKAFEDFMDYQRSGTKDIPTHNALATKAFPDQSTEPASLRLFHTSDHPFKPGDIVNPTTSLEESAHAQGLRDEDEDYEEDHEEDPPMAWARTQPDDYEGSHTFEVEPITFNKHNGRHFSDAEYDPHNTDTDEVVSPTGYRVVQEVTPKNAQ
jgi:hypothetical protein